MSKNCIITTVKSKIKGNATSYIEKENEIIIPVSNKFTLVQTRAIAIDKVKKINKEYLSEKFGDVVSLNTSYTNGTGIKIHPSQLLIDAYEVKEGNKSIEELNPRNLEYFNGDEALFEQEQNDELKPFIDESKKIADEIKDVEQQVQEKTIKPGVEELFNENPDFSSQIYEVLGFEANNSLENKLKAFFNQFGFQYKEGESSTDLLNKIIYTSKKDNSVFIDNSVKALSQLLLANTNIDFHKLESLIEDTPEFKKTLSNSSDYLKTTHKFLKDDNRIPMEEWISYIKDYNKIKNEVLEKIEKETEKVKEKLLSLGLKQDNNKFELITNSYATFRMKLKELENVNAIISTNKTSDFYQIIARLKNTDSTMELKKQGELPFTPIEVKQVIQEQQFLNDVADNVFEGLSEEEKQILKKKIENGDYDLNCRI